MKGVPYITQVSTKKGLLMKINPLFLSSGFVRLTTFQTLISEFLSCLKISDMTFITTIINPRSGPTKNGIIKQRMSSGARIVIDN